jgi:hypothetical protein
MKKIMNSAAQALFGGILAIKHWMLLLSVVTFSLTAEATEGGGSNYLPGFYGDFAMAVFPEQGTFFNNFFAAYRDETSQTGTMLEMPGIIHVSGRQFFGGKYIAGVYPALMATKDHTGENHSSRLGLGDFYLIPAGLNWKWKDLTIFLFEGIVPPTGRYKKGELNTGRNYWTFDHNLLLTLNLPADNEISAAIGYMNNLENPSTDYQSGDEFHFDYNVSHYFGPHFAIGLTGSYYQQTTKDLAPQDSVLPESGRGATIGPALLYTTKINGQDGSISLKWMHEFDAAGRNPQEYLICRILMAF